MADFYVQVYFGRVVFFHFRLYGFSISYEVSGVVLHFYRVFRRLVYVYLQRVVQDFRYLFRLTGCVYVYEVDGFYVGYFLVASFFDRRFVRLYSNFFVHFYLYVYAY